MLSSAMIVNIPFLFVRCKNPPSLLYWDIIQLEMSLASSSKLYMDEIYQRKNIAN